MDSTSEQFVQFVMETNVDDLTPSVIHAVKRSVVDAIGCAYGAFDADPSRAMRKVAFEYTSKHPATIIGTQMKTTPDLAALTNGTMIRYLDFSDDYFGGIGSTGPHPSDNIGAILAAVESIGGGGREVMLGVAIAYEVVGQLVDHEALGALSGWDYPVFHAIATSLAAGKVMGLTREQIGNALTLAVVPNISLRETRGGEVSNWKALAGPNGSRAGLFAAILARAGITGPPAPFEGRKGFMKQIAKFNLDDFGGAGKPFRIERTYFKFTPVRYTLQLAVETAQSIRNEVDLSDVESIKVFIESRSVLKITDDPDQWDPKTRETADHSHPFIIGAALIDGDITEETFAEERFRDPTLLALLQKIELFPDDEYSRLFPGTFKCRFEITMKSGEVHTCERSDPKGHPSNPMSDEEINDKFLKQSVHQIHDEQAHDILDRLWNLDELDDLAALFPHLVVSGADS